MKDFEYNNAWPDEVEEAHRLYVRAVYRAENLEAYIKRVDPSDFPATMDALEDAQKEVRERGIDLLIKRHEWAKKDFLKP
ncbi:MAG: hypothetical protein IJS44_04140 [Clostridia bacterium]|nr:hypothetical protein [Clostridia bacterium]